MIKRVLSILFFFIPILLLSETSAYAKSTVDKPWFHTYVADYENILSSDTSKKLESDLDKLKDNTNVAVYVITIDKLEDMSIDKYCKELISNWKIEGKYVILLTSTKEKQYILFSSKDLQSYISMSTIKDFPTYFNEKKYSDGVLYASNNITSAITSHSAKIKPSDNYKYIWLVVLATIIVYYVKKSRLKLKTSSQETLS